MELAIVSAVVLTVLRIAVPLALTIVLGKALCCVEDRLSESY